MPHTSLTLIDLGTFDRVGWRRLCRPHPLESSTLLDAQSYSHFIDARSRSQLKGWLGIAGD